jgi:hypothetical protein
MSAIAGSGSTPPESDQAKQDAQYNSLMATIEAFRAEMRAEFTALRIPSA